MLASSMRRKASLDELRERKRLYDDAYAVWNTNHQANLFLVREVLQASDYSDFESDVENRLVGEIFRPLDSCLTRAYDARMAEQDPNPILQACSVSDLIQQALDCGYALTNELYKLSSADGDALRGQQQGAESEVSERCP
jgi:hypothetical protein